MTKEEWYKQLFEHLESSKFRSSFHLKQKDLDYINEKGLDASDVMIGSRIGTVNSSVEECTPMYRKIEKETGVTCYFRIMKYSTWASWVNSEWQSRDDLIFNDIQASGES